MAETAQHSYQYNLAPLPIRRIPRHSNFTSEGSAILGMQLLVSFKNTLNIVSLPATDLGHALLTATFPLPRL